MKQFISIIILFFAVTYISIAQNESVTKAKSLNIIKEIKPPIINFVTGSMRFVEPSGNNAIDALERCAISFQISNSGKGDGLGCVVKVRANGNTDGVTYSNLTLPTIKVGESKTVEIPVTASMGTIDGKMDFTIDVYEPNGFGPDPIYLSVNTKKFLNPMVKVVDYTVTGAGSSGVLTKRTPFDLQLLLQNTEYGQGENVQVEIIVPEGVFLMDGNRVTTFPSLASGEQKSLVYGIIVNNNYSSNTIPIKVKLSEKFGKYAESRDITLNLNQTLASSKIVVDEKAVKRADITIASLTSDVDKNIPSAAKKQNKTFAVIIANENYLSEASVPYAMNDGNIFKEYCEKTLGIPSTNIRFNANATLNVLRNDIDWLKNVINSYKGEAKVIFYYAGHGIPDEAEKTAYLLPVDGSGSNYKTGFKLNELYAMLTEHPSESVTVFLDACFSGTKREGGMLAENGRGIAIRVKETAVPGNMVVFSASQGDQTAYPMESEKHGMFTYFLLKKLQESSGNVSYQELGDYITTNVSQKSIVLNGKSQTPKITPSIAVEGVWKGWRLIK